MSETISKASVCEILADIYPTDGEKVVAVREVDKAYEAIQQLPSAQQWIPVSERLPKPYEYCLWTTTDGRVIYHHCDGLFSNYTAWMPLPEPYRERTE